MTLMHHTENQISERNMSMSNHTTLDMSTKYQNPSTKGRLTTISRNELSYNRAKQHYQEALAKGGHRHDLKYNAGNSKKTKIKNKNTCISRHRFVCR